MKELTPKMKCEHSLTARRGKCHKVIEGDGSGEKKRILSPKKIYYSSRIFIKSGSGDKGITPHKTQGSRETANALNTVQSMVEVSCDFWKVRSTRGGEAGPQQAEDLSPHHHKIYDGTIFYLIIAVDLLIQILAKDSGITGKTLWSYFVLLISIVCFNVGIFTYPKGDVKSANKGYNMTEKQHDTKDCVISVSGLVAEEATGKALASTSDIYACKSTHDLTTLTLCHFMWRKWFTFCTYYMCLLYFVIFYASQMLSGCKDRVTAFINTFISWTSTRTSTHVFETKKHIAKSFTVNFTAIEHPPIHAISSVFHMLVPNLMPAKFPRRRFFKRSSTTIMLALSIIAGSQAQQVSLQFLFLIL